MATLDEKLKLEKTQSTAFKDKLTHVMKLHSLESEKKQQEEKTIPGMGDEVRKMLANMGGGGAEKEKCMHDELVVSKKSLKEAEELNTELRAEIEQLKKDEIVVNSITVQQNRQICEIETQTMKPSILHSCTQTDPPPLFDELDPLETKRVKETVSQINSDNFDSESDDLTHSI